MKLVVYSDLHAHPFKGGQILAEGRNSRVDDALGVIDTVYAYAENIEATVIFGGDLFDRRKSIDVDTYNKVHQTISDHTARAVMIPGNHDQANKSGTIHALERFHSKRCQVVSDPSWTKIQGGGSVLGVFAVPYTDDGEIIASQVAEGIDRRPEWAEKALLLMHYGVQGAKVGPSDYVLPCELELPMLQPSQWDLILSGHYHIGQQLGDRFHYIGSAMQHRWDDMGFSKTFMVIDTDDWSIDRVSTGAPEFLVVKGKTAEHNVENCFIKIIRDYEMEPAKKEKIRRKLLDRGAVSVIFDFEPSKVNKQKSSRIEFSEDRGVFGILEDYIGSDLVGTGDLDTDKLISVGKELLEQASA